VKIVDSEGKVVLSSTGQLTDYKQLKEVKEAIVSALKKLGTPVPDYFV